MNDDDFPGMKPAPDQMSDTNIHRLFGDKFKQAGQINLAMLPGLGAALKGDKIASMPANEKEEHPAAKWLYRRWKAGSATLSKSDAFYIGNELDALYARVRELEKAGGSLVRQVLSARESLTAPQREDV